MKKIALGAVIGISVIWMSACTSTSQQSDFLANSEKYGANPYVTPAFAQDLEQRLITILKAERSVSANSGLHFDPRNQAILDNFSEHFDQAELEQWIEQSKVSFDAFKAQQLTNIGSQEHCQIAMQEARFANNSNDPISFNWQFQQGTCDQNDLAHGMAYVTAPQAQAQFIGTFEHGQPTQGRFTMTRKDGRIVLQQGGIASSKQSAHFMTTITRPSDYQWHRYGMMNAEGKLNGFGINIWGYTDLLHVRAAGQFQQDRLHGFGISQTEIVEDNGAYRPVTVGYFEAGLQNGWSAWTNTINRIIVAQWQQGKRHGISYDTEYNTYEGIYRYEMGPYDQGQRHGPFKITQHSMFGESQGEQIYDHGQVLEDPNELDWGQVFALTAGATIIGTAELDSNTKAAMSQAYLADFISGDGTQNMRQLQQAKQINADQQSTQGGSPLKEYQANIQCPDTGVSTTITVPYRTEACRVAAVDFATTYSCNKLDQERVMSNCQSACGHPQCLQQ
ncbi:hypothetical protein [Marinomonas ostreistagni]|uniref:hypothetical protein n=1 Tax=Marinomonas ostreistagni TaxID=359209 RepID=UPI001951EA4D|nr:hypothetical protein [Marinomonas ostreistagni]MBM6550165.1 hypothetical protein [Marinomonas ostreistagni]